MAQQTIIQLIDDLDGTQFAEGKGETIRFALDGVEYEIDLTTRNAKKFRDSIAPYVGSARKTSGRSVRRARNGGGPARADREQLQAIREWARANGYEINDRGRIPATIVEAYNAG